MSDKNSNQNTTNKIALANIDLPDSVDHAIENVSTPLTKNVGQTFGDLWYLVFGGISQAAEKRKLKYSADLTAFKNELDEKINQIPDDKRVEPNMQTVCPALENSKYCVESEELRTMFANLISRSMNKDYLSSIHPSFADILKQMSPLDAQNLLLFKDKFSIPICDIHLTLDGQRGYSCLFKNFFIANKEQDDFDLQAQSISSLIHFGLVAIPALETFTNKDYLKDFENHYFFQGFKIYLPEQIGKITLSEHKVDITPLGQAFIKACL